MNTGNLRMIHCDVTWKVIKICKNILNYDWTCIILAISVFLSSTLFICWSVLYKISRFQPGNSSLYEMFDLRVQPNSEERLEDTVLWLDETVNQREVFVDGGSGQLWI